ncbi:AMP-binding protein [Duncaniella freteri]|jgi:long-chain acyl-CoA synthetase|uniref:Long-chain fatty acid--CoA ligase n=15 Tax=Duncaniella TaxID=2518495 RepID=A0A4Z0V4T8_9BACT|nr:AMP-binding protein [Duncaniella freteri]MDE7027705.1 AMP-binding protein [Duncaniella freteri]TGG36353.1 long-chain fatty acid--CoA ligase [Duncaniella freteri]
MEARESLNEYFRDSIRRNWNLPAFTDLGATTMTYKDVARKIAKLHILYKEIGIVPGDKVALCGKNSSQWCVAFLATVTYGAVIVPILADFKPDNIQHLINHSDAKLAIIDEAVWEALNPDGMTRISGALCTRDFSLIHSNDEKLTHTRAHLNELFGQAYPDRFTPEDVNYYKEDNDELCLISYTSGSTGFSKGVMLPYRSLWSNVRYCMDYLPSDPGDGVVCMLPLAHMYGLTIDMLRPFVSGNHIHVLTRTPSPRILVEAFAQVRPRYIVAVPLIIEKIIRTRVFPLLEKPLMKLMLMVPFVDDRLLARILDRLKETFGGNLQEIIIGGAALNKDVERFLRRCNFPYTVGYGMTECGPLIAYAPCTNNRMASCGRIVDRIEAKVSSPNPASVPGILYVKGTNVMLGYYKNPEATAEAIDDDGWLCTGDICNLDEEGFLYVRGRDKNMILGPSGQNIYPEEIEDKLNNLPYVSESLIVDSGAGRLVALIFPDLEAAQSQGFTDSDIEKIMDENIRTLNESLPGYSQVQSYRIQQEEFEKTPKRSIKRYLYK